MSPASLNHKQVFYKLHEALQFPPMMWTANRLALDLRDALLIVLRALGSPRGSQQWLPSQAATEA
jgi:hypothetical protein